MGVMSGQPADLAAAALRLLDPETAHAMAHKALTLGLGPRARKPPPSLGAKVAGLTLPSPIGLAAGFDKDARTIAPLLGLGFGFVECGTVTPRPQAGNPKPRLFRLEEDQAIVNRMGFNNEGLASFVERLKRRPANGIVGANVGANKDSEDRIADFVTGLTAVYPHADYVTVNVSSPNTPGLRDLQARSALEELLGRLREARAALADGHGRRPIFLKVAPDLVEAEARDFAEAAAAAGIDGLIVSNTTIARPASLCSRAKSEMGGLSGRPLFDPSTRMLRTFAGFLGKRVPLIGAGGVENGATALAKIKAGASAVQLYTALIYGGPGLPARIAQDLAMRLSAEGFATVADAVGADLT